MDKVMICRELEWLKHANNEVHYYKVPEGWKESAKEGQFALYIRLDAEKQNVSILIITEVTDLMNLGQIDLTPLSENESIHLVSQEFFLHVSEDIIADKKNATTKELRKCFRKIIKEMNIEMYFAKTSPLSNERKEYLQDLFWHEKLDEFNKMSMRDKNRWFRIFNKYELGFIQMINLYNLKSILMQLIEANTTLCNIDKFVIKHEFLNELEIEVSSSYLKGNVNFQEEQYLGFDFSSDGKDLVIGKASPLEFNLSLVSFWNLIKGLLTVSYIPILVAFLMDPNRKVILYCLLGIIYFITLVLSDEKQTDKLLSFINEIKQDKDKKVNHGTLFYYGIMAVLIFVIFTIQIVYLPSIVDNIGSFIMYLAGDVIFAFVVLLLIVIITTFFYWIITVITSTIFYLKRAMKFYVIFSLCIKVIFLIFSNYCVFSILQMKTILLDSQLVSYSSTEWKLILYMMVIFISLLNLSVYISEFKEKIKFL